MTKLTEWLPPPIKKTPRSMASAFIQPNTEGTMEYRAFDIERNKEGYTVRKDGKLIGSQPSEEFARHMIDRIIRERSDWPQWRNV